MIKPEIHELQVDIHREWKRLFPSATSKDRLSKNIDQDHKNYLPELGKLTKEIFDSISFPDVVSAEECRKIRLRLLRYVPEATKTAEPRRIVLLLHGASASSRTFSSPVSARVREDEAADEGDNSVLSWLLFVKQYEVWLLDWRASFLVTRDYLDRCRETDEGLDKYGVMFNFDVAAAVDIPRALRKICSVAISDYHDQPRELYLIGHCMGAGTLSIAIAQGVFEQYRNMENTIEIGGIGLSTLGLFYDVHFDGHLKTQDHVLERIRTETPYIDPANRESESLGHEQLDGLYKNWKKFWATHRKVNGTDSHNSEDESGLSEADRFCNKLSFLYGLPFRESNLNIPVMHENLVEQFGGIPTDMYLQAVRNTRTGWATPFVIGGDLSEIAEYEEYYICDCARREFDNIPRILLMTGKENRLWHRNSIDFMYEWLLRGSLNRIQQVKKHPVTRYGHQDLFWGKQAHKDVFDKHLSWLFE